MLLIPTSLGALTLNTNYAVKFAYLERGTSYIKVTASSDANGDVKVTFYDSTHTLVQKTDYLPATMQCWQVDLTQ